MPKCPPTAVWLYIGLLRFSFSIIADGLKSKTFLTISSRQSSQTFPVSNVSMLTLVGSDLPIACDTAISQSSAKPYATMLLATYLAKYAPLRSTFVASFPENAPPPKCARPP